jgi:predicted RNA-binding Zn ribbon-like protein
MAQDEETKVSDNMNKAYELRSWANNALYAKNEVAAAILEIAIAIRETSEPVFTTLEVQEASSRIDLEDLLERLNSKKEYKHTNQELEITIAWLRNPKTWQKLDFNVEFVFGRIANMLEERL